MYPCNEHYGFLHSMYDGVEVVNDGFLVRVKHAST